MRMNNVLKSFMPKMGTGSRSSEPLTYEESREAMESILDGDAEPATFGAFTVAERWKGQEPEELAGFLDEIRSRGEYFIEPDRDDIIDVAGRFDGKSKSINTDFVSSIVAAACGTSVFTHSGRDIPTQEDTTLLDIAEEFGWTPPPAMVLVKDSLEEHGFAYANQSEYAPDLESIRSLRADLGVRTFINTIESMVNPSGATRHVGSFYHLPYARRICETFNQSQTMQLAKVIMIQGIEGQTEFRPGVSMLGISTNGSFEDREIATSDLGLDFDRDELESEGASAEVSAERMIEYLRGNPISEAYEKNVLLNASVKLFAAGTVESLDEGQDRARDVVESGEALDFFKTVEEVFERG